MTTYRSESRGLVYTAPPSGDEENRTRTKSDAAEDASESDAASEEETESGSPTLEPTSATTDANWTGTVPADD